MAKVKRKEKTKDKDRNGDRASKKRRREEDERSSSSSVTPPKSKRPKDSSRTMKHKHSKRDREKDHHNHARKKESNKKEMDDRKKSKKKESRDKHRSDGDKRKHKRDEDSAEAKSRDTGFHAPGETAVKISEEDYFMRATEFKVWLFQKKRTFFEDLSSTEAHALFAKFVKDWNRGKLDAHFYEARLPEELVAQAKKTRHKWGFVERLTDRDQMQLASTNDSVHASTEKVRGVASNVPALTSESAKQPLPPAETNGHDRVGGGGARGGKDRGRADEHGDEGDAGRKKSEHKRKRKREREKHAVVLDEMAPKETGRQAIIDKRREVGARTHAAAREREQAADGLDLGESETMGGGDSFQEALKRSHEGKQRRQAAKQEMLMELAAKEEEKRAAFMAQMGLKQGQKITIRPRSDG